MDEHLIDKWWNRLPLNDAEFNKFSVDQMHHQSEFTQCVCVGRHQMGHKWLCYLNMCAIFRQPRVWPMCLGDMQLGQQKFQ